MNKTGKILIIIASALVIIGFAGFVGIMSARGWDFKSIDPEDYTETTAIQEDDFDAIKIMSGTEKITFKKADDDKSKVVFFEKESIEYSASVIDNALVIETHSKNGWLSFVGMSFNEPSITVYLPKTKYDSLTIKESTGKIEIPGDFSFTKAEITLSTGNTNYKADTEESLKIKSSTGSINISGISVGEMNLSVSTGNINLTSVTCSGDIVTSGSTGKCTFRDVTCSSLKSTATTGNVEFENVIAGGSADLKRSTGSVRLNSFDASDIRIKTSTGSVKGTLLSEKIFTATSDTGSINVPKTQSGGSCVIETDTGSIKIEIEKK